MDIKLVNNIQLNGSASNKEKNNGESKIILKVKVLQRCFQYFVPDSVIHFHTKRLSSKMFWDKTQLKVYGKRRAVVTNRNIGRV